MWAESGRRPELRCEMHARKPGHLGKIGETDAFVEMRADVFLDALHPPLGQGLGGMPRRLDPRDVHDQGLADARDVDAVALGALFDQRLAEQFGKRVTDDEIVQVRYWLGPAGPRRLLALTQIIG